LTTEEKNRPSAFTNAIRDINDFAKKETGFPVDLRPDQQGLLSGVASSLTREQTTANQARAGGEQAQGILTGIFRPVEPPPFLKSSVTLARFVLEKIGVNTKNKTIEELAREIQDPATAAKLMREATPNQWAAMKQVVEATTPRSLLGSMQSLPQVQ
jgi:hypothetical protein